MSNFISGQDITKSNFFKSINKNDSSLMSERSELVALNAEQAQKTIIDKLRADVRKAKENLLKLQDFGRKSKDSLVVVDENFDADDWAEKFHKISFEVYGLEVELGIAENNYKKFFTEEPSASSTETHHSSFGAR